MKNALSLAAVAALSTAVLAAPAAALQQKPTEPTSSSSSSTSGGSSGGTAVPEPAGLAVLGLGLGLYFGGVQMRRRRNKK
jgi:uncharacterized protein HemX